MALNLSGLTSWLHEHGLPTEMDEAIDFVSIHKWQLAIAGTLVYITYKIVKQRQLPPGPYCFPFVGYMLQAEGFGNGTGQKKMVDYGEMASVKMGKE